MESNTPFTTQKESLLFRTIGLFVLGFLFIFFLIEVRAPSTLPDTGGEFTITQNESLKGIGTDLQSKGFIRSRVLFANLVIILGGEKHISPGDYFVAGHSDTITLALQVARGRHGVDPLKVTVAEGLNVKEIAAVFAQKNPKFSQDEFVQKATQYEGYLFPETYFIYPSTTVDAVIKEMCSMFDLKTKDFFAKLNSTHSEADIVIMASIIEREAHGPEDRNIISDILWKRYNQGMYLQVDAAPETYTKKGLPANPIANPGLESLAASANSVDTPYLYYLHDSHGSIHYATTFAEHQKNIKKYLK